MLHLSLALYIVSFSMGIAALVLSLFAHATYRDRAFLRLATLFGSIAILLVVSVLTTYDRVVPGEFGRWLVYAVPALSSLGSAMFAYSVTTIVLNATSARASAIRNAVLFLLVILMAALGGSRDWIARSSFPELTLVAFALIEIYGVVVLLRGLPRIENTTTRAFFRQLAVIILLMTVLCIVELASRRVFHLPQFFQDFPFVEIISFLSTIALLIYYAARFLLKAPSVNACVLTEEFVQTYGISPRECEIVSMMIRGFNNRMIGEKLFISTATVKNHVYHIYQKTGVANKVQLMNLINPPK